MPWTFWADSFFLWYFSIINGFYAFVLILGMLRTYFRKKELSIEDFTNILHSNSMPEICFIIPMYNESENICRTVQSILNLSYRYKAIIVVNDGSTDSSIDQLKQTFDLLPCPIYYSQTLSTAQVRSVYRSKKNPELIVVDKEHCGKYDALNAGLNACSHPFFIVADADSFIDNKMFETLIRPLLFDTDTVGIGATIRIRNGCQFKFNRIDTKGFPDCYLTGMQGAEYLRSFLMRQGWDWIGGNFLIAGAFSVFSTPLIRALGGFSNTVAEDVEIVLRIHRVMRELNIPYKIVYLPDPVSWTEAPSTWRKLGNQRIRWHFGLLQSVWYHKTAYFNPKYGIFGWIVYPFMVWGEALEPLIEVMGYIYIIVSAFLGILNIPFFILFILFSFGFTFFYTLTCLLIEELSFKTYLSFRTILLMISSCFFENFGYRQMNVLWKILGFARFFRFFPQVLKQSKKINQSIQTICKKSHLFSN